MPQFPTYSEGSVVKFRRRVPPALKRLRNTLQEGELVKHGYSMHGSARSRHDALEKSVREDGPATTYRRLNLIFIWNKRRHPSLAKIAHADRNWVAKKHARGIHLELARER